MLTFQVATFDGVKVITLANCFCDCERGILKAALTSVLNNAPRASVVLDLSGVTTIEEGMWEVLREFHDRCYELEGVCCIADVPDDVAICMHLSCDCFKIFPSVAEALASLASLSNNAHPKRPSALTTQKE